MQIIRAADKYTYNTVDGRKLCTSYIRTGSLPHNIYIQGLMHPRWCRISSINRRCVRVCTNNRHTIVHFYTLTHITTYQCIHYIYIETWATLLSKFEPSLFQGNTCPQQLPLSWQAISSSRKAGKASSSNLTLFTMTFQGSTRCQTKKNVTSDGRSTDETSSLVYHGIPVYLETIKMHECHNINMWYIIYCTCNCT